MLEHPDRIDRHGRSLLKDSSMRHKRSAIQLATRALVLACLAAPAVACIAPTPRAQTELRPALIGDIAVWPDKLSIGAGALLSLQLPVRAKVEISGQPVQPNATPPVQPVVPLDESRFRDLGGRTAELDLPMPRKLPADWHEWRRFGGAGPGEARLTIRSGKSTKEIDVTVLPAQPVARGRVIMATEEDAAAGRPLTPDGYDTIQLTVPGTLQDDWRVTPVEGTGFRWVGIQLVHGTPSGAPRVKLDFARAGSEQGNELVVARRQGDRHVFRIAHRSTVTGC